MSLLSPSPLSCADAIFLLVLVPADAIETGEKLVLQVYDSDLYSRSSGHFTPLCRVLLLTSCGLQTRTTRLARSRST